jgi:hypothetical protein
VKEGTQELYAGRQHTGSRTYFFDIERGPSGSTYLKISQSRKRGEGFEHQRVIVFEEDVAGFVDELLKAVSAIGEAHGLRAVRPGSLEAQSAEVPRQSPPRIAEIKQKNPRAYEPWTAEEDAQLKQELAERKPLAEIAAAHQRQPSAIRSRIERFTL